MQSSITAIIPARAGSKGIPGKNLKLVNGKTLIERAITVAQRSLIFDDIVVSTDWHELAEVARKLGAIVHNRSPKASGDDARSEEALTSAIEDLGIATSHIGFLECTSPFIDPVDLNHAWKKLLTGRYDSLFSASPTNELHWVERGFQAFPVGHDPTNQTPRQQREETLVETGAFYFFTAAGFKEHRNRFFGRIGTHRVPRLHSLEIDYPDDLFVAELLAPELDGRIFSERGSSNSDSGKFLC